MMSGTVEAAKRALEKKPGGSNTESPQKKQASAEEEEEGVIEESKVEKMFKIRMKKMGDVETKMDGVKSKFDYALQMSEEAKEGVKKASEEVKAVKDDIDKEKRERKEWQSAMEEKLPRRSIWIQPQRCAHRIRLYRTRSTRSKRNLRT